MKITFKQLEVFIAIAKLGNMSLAAEDLHLTQSACSMSLSTMENQLGGPLFDRNGKKLLLNERGKMLFPKAANIITQAHELQNLLINTNSTELSGHLIVGASTTIGNYILPKIIGDFITAFPNIKFTVQIDNTEKVIQDLAQFKIDIGMIEGKCSSDKINVLPWKKDELIIVAAKKYFKHKITTVTQKYLQEARWILRETGSGTREKFEEAMGGKITPFLELGNTEAIKQAVLEGLGISCLSRTTVAELLKNGRLIELKAPFLKLSRDFFILLHKEKYKTAILNEFIKANFG